MWENADQKNSEYVHFSTKSNTSPWIVSHVFKTVQMVANRKRSHFCGILFLTNVRPMLYSYIETSQLILLDNKFSGE